MTVLLASPVSLFVSVSFLFGFTVYRFRVRVFLRALAFSKTYIHTYSAPTSECLYETSRTDTERKQAWANGAAQTNTRTEQAKMRSAEQEEVEHGEGRPYKNSKERARSVSHGAR